MSEAVALQDGYQGSRTVLSGTDAHTAAADGHAGWKVIQILADGTTFSVLTDADNVGGALVGETFDKGDFLFGRFTAVTRSAGKYRMFRGTV
jgi:hypothetical protein